MPKTTYRNHRLEVLHKTAAALHAVGALDESAMRDIHSFCPAKAEAMSGEEIQAPREREGVSQAVLARHINVAIKLVSEWERGAKHPSGPSLKLSTLVGAKGLDAIA